MPHAAVRLFASGGHPAILSRAEAAKEEILAFWLRCEAAERLGDFRQIQLERRAL